MKAIYYLKAVALFFLISTSLKAQTYQMVWSDEFTNGISSDWNFEVGDIGAGNNELEYYRKENASVENGALVITAKKEDFGGKNYTSARLNTSGKKSFRYGKMEARIKLPAFSGSWPAFWMLGDNIWTDGWPKCGEIDIMEQVNIESHVFGTIHWNGPSGYTHFGNNSTDFNVKDYNVYSIEWDANSIKWFVNGTLFGTANIQNSINNTGAFHNKMFLLLNLAVGGKWPGYNIDNNAFPAKMYVDYVRVYQSEVCSTVSVPGILQAENYCDMDGIQLESSNDAAAGQNVGYVDAGDWMAYKINVPVAGEYALSYRVASNAIGASLKFEALGGGTIYGTIDVPNTGGWQKWQTITHNVQLPAGQLNVAVATPSGGFNLNWMDFSSTVSSLELKTERLKVYPNPVSDLLRIDSQYALREISIYDAAGRLVLTLQNPGTAVNTENLAKGFYTMVVDDAEMHHQIVSFVK
ncbi:MAG: family 16 glycosylhydrolase [Bacteroidetes bacterium]|nr:family 16 glycosylhydrolase [Bacteroidota bacterium]